MPYPESERQRGSVELSACSSAITKPDFASLARVCGMHGARVETADELEPAMDRWLNHDGPALLDVRVSRLELVMPGKLEVSQLASGA